MNQGSLDSKPYLHPNNVRSDWERPWRILNTLLREKVLRSPGDLVKTPQITSDSMSFPRIPFLSGSPQEFSLVGLLEEERKFSEVTQLVSSTSGPDRI